MKELSVAEIITLMEALSKNGLGSLKLRSGDYEIKLESAKIQAVAAPVGVPAQADFAAPAAAQPAPVPEAQPCGQIITSPIVGTYYQASSPEAEPFVRVGQQVKKGDVLFIIESMKLMNEVTSDCEGTVAEILVENEQAVEFGQPILRMQ